MASRNVKPSGKVFRDPIHRLIRIDREDEFLLHLIDTPEFQRLRRIRQLGVSWLVYPGAEHSRFVHSLGVLNFVQRMLEVLRRRYSDHAVGKYLTEHSKVAKAAALLHDIGHGPFSHMIERAFPEGSHHEDNTVELIRDPKGGILPVLQEAKIDPEQVAGLIQHTIPHPLLIDLVTSQLDADRMDYLLRDSYCTGVQYGSYDAEWLLNAMCVGSLPADDGAGEPSRGWRLALDDRRGEKAAEQFILARAHMNEQVYFHRVTRGFEAMLLNVFRLAGAAAKSEGLPIGTPEVVSEFFRNDGNLSSHQWMMFDEAVIVTALHAWSRTAKSDTPLARLSGAFLRRERVYCSVPLQGVKPLQLPKLFDALRDAGLIEFVHWCTDDIDSAVYKGMHYTIARGDENAGSQSILLASGKPTDKPRPIEATSGLMDYLDRQKQSITRMYLDRSRLADVSLVLKTFRLRPESGGNEE